MKASRFATPRPSAQQGLQQEPEQKSDATVKRHSAPGSSKKHEGKQSPTGIDSSQDAKTKSLKRQSMPPVARKPLACVSNKVVSKTPGSKTSGSNVKLSAAGLADDDSETLPNRKRKLVTATAARSTSARTVIDDDDDFA